MKYIAIAINGKWWIPLCDPTTKEIANRFDGAQCRNETFSVVTEMEFSNYVFTLE